MIPPLTMERARLAFWNEDGNLDMKLNAAFRSLSAAWPEADGRLKEAAERWVASFGTPDSTMDGASPEAQALVRAVLDRAALSPPSAPAADVRIVRVPISMVKITLAWAQGTYEGAVLVAMNDGTFWIYGEENEQWKQIDGPPVPTVRASVEAPHE